MDSQVSLQLSQRGEVQTALHTYVLLPFFMLQLMCAELAGIGEPSTTHPAAGGADKRAYEKENLDKR